MKHQAIAQRVVAFGLTLVLAACASGYAEFYKPADGATPERIAAGRVAPPTGQPIVEHSSAPNDRGGEFFDAYAKRGYAPIGEASFSSGRKETEEAAVQQGRKVGADLVLIFDPSYAGSTTTAMPLVTPTSSTSYVSGAFGSATATTYGTSTMMMPITVHRSNYGAVFFVKWKYLLGAYFRRLDDGERQALQSNKGVVVRFVVDGTPAYQADILPGDIILAVDGASVFDEDSMGDALQQRSGRAVTLSIYRRGSRLEKSVQLNPA